MSRRQPRIRRRLRPLALLVAGSVLAAERAEAQVVISVYGGASYTFDTDLELQQPFADTDLHFSDVPWDGEPFDSPPYFGVRLTYWGSEDPHLGVALDFTHAKLVAELDDTVNVTGTRVGVPVSGEEPLGDTFEALELGHNMLTVNALYRWFPQGRPDETPRGRLQPYAGIGAGVALPHVEVQVNGVRTDEYQFAGPAVQGLVGLNYELTRHFAVFGEYKLSWADIDADLENGGSLGLEPFTNHLVFGVGFGF